MRTYCREWPLEIRDESIRLYKQGLTLTQATRQINGPSLASIQKWVKKSGFMRKYAGTKYDQVFKNKAMSLYKKGMSTLEISRLPEMPSREILLSWAKRAGVFRGPEKYSGSIKKRALKLYASGLSAYETSKKLNGPKPQAVYIWAKKAGVSRSFHQYSKKTKEEAKALYLTGLTSKEIAKELSLVQGTVSGWVYEAGLSRGNGQCYGEKCWNWKGGVTSEAQKLRKTDKYKKWRMSVFIRDSFICQHCGQKGGQLHAHHILFYIEYPDLQLCVDNGQTLCVSCHKKLHKKLRKTG